jgi:hypothetical protein
MYKKIHKQVDQMRQKRYDVDEYLKFIQGDLENARNILSSLENRSNPELKKDVEDALVKFVETRIAESNDYNKTKEQE